MTKLNPKQLQAVILISQGKTNKEVSNSLNVVPHTVGVWTQNPAFMAEVNKLKMEALESARASIQNSSSLAVSTLIDIMENSKNDEIKRKVAMDILRMTGFEPGHHEVFAWGIGKTTAEGIEQDMSGSLSMSELFASIVV